jgi:hypothetical protein
MSNKYLIENKSTLIKEKLLSLADKLTGGYSPRNFQTKEQLMQEIVSILTIFAKTLNKPIFTAPVFLTGDIADPNYYNQVFNNILKDLTILFTEIENLESVIVNNFNTGIVESNRLTARLKTIASLLSDYILYSKISTKDIQYFSDSFNDLSKIEIESELARAEYCYVNHDEGVVTLPVDLEKESRITTSYAPVINSNSTGIIGNNQELDADYHGNIRDVLDNNPDTWFEYEKIVSTTDTNIEPLILDLTINLDKEQIINFIRINPNNFNNKTVLQIDKIEISTDGKIFTSIKEDIPISNFIDDNEDTTFILSSSSSKYNGQGLYTFTPRQVKFIHCVFRQEQSYPIQTSSGEKLRYAIGIRDIDLRNFTYKEAGELISILFSMEEEIKKVTLEVNQNPVINSDLVTIDYLISPDNGQTWNTILPNSADILNYNSYETTAIQTSVPVYSLRLKALLSRNNDAFKEGSSFFAKTQIPFTELFSISDDTPIELELNKFPIPQTMQVIDALYGSRGKKDNQYVIGKGKTAYRIPFTLPREFKKTTISGTPNQYKTRLLPQGEQMHVFVGGEEWAHTENLLSDYAANYSTASQFRLFAFDASSGVLSFGNGLNTMSPPNDAEVSFYFEEEHLFPSAVQNMHNAKLVFPCGGNKDRTILRYYEEPAYIIEKLPELQTAILLQHGLITDTSRITTSLIANGYITPQNYINGIDELVTDTDWSLDSENGILYLHTGIPDGTIITIDYLYQPVKVIDSKLWNFTDTNELVQEIIITEEGWQTTQVEYQEISATNATHIRELEHFNIVKGSLEFLLRDASTETEVDADEDPFLKEIDFIDGKTELGLNVKMQLQAIGYVTPVDGIIAFQLKSPILEDPQYGVNFTPDSFREYFETADNDIPTLDGHYFIDRDPDSNTYGMVYLKKTLTFNQWDSIAKYAKVMYFTAVKPKPDQGLYSVDYHKGIVYSQRPIPTGSWILSAKYQYTDYRLEYDIARLIPSTDWVYNQEDNKIEIQANEILNQKLSNKLDDQKLFYQVNYKYVGETAESIESLRDYFTPVLKDYIIKVITKDRLI